MDRGGWNWLRIVSNGVEPSVPTSRDFIKHLQFMILIMRYSISYRVHLVLEG
jgi:hypothetical protein